jgi:guanylate kinase
LHAAIATTSGSHVKNLFLIDGAAGTGKSDLVQYVLDYSGDDVGLVRKYSTRDVRDYEQLPGWKLDLDIVDNDEFQALGLDYSYKYGGQRYGFFRKDLVNALKTYSNVFVIVRSAKVIEKLQKEFHFINVVPVYVYTGVEEVMDRLRKLNFTDEEIDFRIKRHRMANEDYMQNPTLYREVILNATSN